MTTHSPEIPQIDILGFRNPRPLPHKIAIPANQIQAEKWATIVNKTDIEGVEHGLLISHHKGKFHHSIITGGFRRRPDYNGSPGAKLPASWSPSLFPHGLSSWWRYPAGMKDVLTIHSHPMPPELNHIQTSNFSETDLKNFFESNLWASIMVDRGGAHLLTRQSPDLPGQFSAEEIIKKAYEGKNYVIDVLIAIANGINLFGLQYYYTPEIDHEESGLVVFTDARFLQPIAKIT